LMRDGLATQVDGCSKQRNSIPIVTVTVKNERLSAEYLRRFQLPGLLTLDAFFVSLFLLSFSLSKIPFAHL